MIRYLTILILLCSVGNAATYYVRTDGSNSNNGLTNSTGGAWLTVSNATQNAVAGDVVQVQAGTYTERPTETTDGVSTNFINYLGNGLVTIYGGWYLNGSDYVRIRNFTIRHDDVQDSRNYPGILFSNSTGSEALDCVVTNCDNRAIEVQGSPNTVIRGCGLYRMSPTDYPEMDAAIYCRVSVSHGCVIEYNRIENTGDFVLPFGTNYVIRNNYFGTVPTNMLGHVDGVQANSSGDQHMLFEANWQENEQNGDNHLGLSFANWRWIWRGNVSTLTAGSLLFQGSSFNNYAYHNTWVSNYVVNGSTFFIRAQETSLTNDCRNNVFYRSTTPGSGTIYSVAAGSGMTFDYDISFESGDPAEANDKIADPLFVDLNGRDYRLQSGSPATNHATFITQAAGGGSSSVDLVVDDAWRFWNGDWITVGGTSNTIVTVNSQGSITLASAISWSDNDPVRWEGRQDLGAFPIGTTFLSAATYSVSGNDYTVTPDGDTRFVIFFADGVPHTTDAAAPYIATIGSGTVTVRAYARYAQQVAVFAATESNPPEPLNRSVTGRVTISGTTSL